MIPAFNPLACLSPSLSDDSAEDLQREHCAEDEK